MKHPSANSLVIFEVVSRHLSFTKASEELKTTRVAVSSQIKLLEGQLGCSLFRRHHRGLRLTQAGAALAETVSPSFQAISDTLDRFVAPSQEHQLAISASHGMSSHWLMPRLHRFRKKHSDVDFRFQITDTYVDLDEHGIDVALRYGDGPWPNVALKRLIRVERFPVCSPKYIESAGRLDSLHDLENHTLLFLAGNYGRLTRWDEWLRTLGIEDVRVKPGLTLDDHNSLVEAVLAGEGIALGGPPQISDYLVQRQLLRVLQPYSTYQKYFWSVRSDKRTAKPIALAFEEWLEEEMLQSLQVTADGNVIDNGT